MAELYPIAMTRRIMATRGRPLNWLERANWVESDDRYRIVWCDDDAYISDEEDRIKVYSGGVTPSVYADATDSRWRDCQ